MILRCVGAAIAVVLSAGLAQADEAIRWHYDLDAAWQSAQATGRPLVLFLTSDRCLYCERMKNDAWLNPEVAAAVQRQFVAAEINTQHHQQLLEVLNIEMLPTTLVISPDRKILERLSGQVSSQKLLDRLNKLPVATLPVSTESSAD